MSLWAGQFDAKRAQARNHQAAARPRHTPRSITPVASALLQRHAPCACGGGCPSCQAEAPAQAKLKVSTPGDAYEREADSVAEQIMSMTPPASAASSRTGLSGANLLQRSCSDCQSARDEETLQTKETAGDLPGAAPEAQTQIDGLRGGGQPLPRDVRAFFEPRFGYDFSAVRTHTDSGATAAARDFHARAFTVGRDIVFGAGEYRPDTAAGQRLLAHELAHVAQQGGGRPERVQPAETETQTAPPIRLTRQTAAPMMMRSTITDGFLTFRTEAVPDVSKDDNFKLGDTAVQLLLRTARYRSLHNDLKQAFQGAYQTQIPTVLTQFFRTSGSRILCNSDAAGCCRNCQENCNSLGISAPSEFQIFSELHDRGDDMVIKPSSFPAGCGTVPEVGTASTMFHELLHLWFFQFLCVFKNAPRPETSGHSASAAFDPLFAQMWGEACLQIDAEFKKLPKEKPAAQPEQTARPRTVEDLGDVHASQTSRRSGGRFQFGFGGGSLTEVRPGETVHHPIIWGDLGYRFPADESSRRQFSLSAGGLLVPGERLGAVRAQAGLRLLQGESVTGQRPENPFYFDFKAGVLYRIDERPEEGQSSPGVTGGIGVGKVLKLGGVELSVGADATYLYQWQLEHPHAVIFGGRGELRW